MTQEEFDEWLVSMLEMEHHEYGWRSVSDKTMPELEARIRRKVCESAQVYGWPDPLSRIGVRARLNMATHSVSIDFEDLSMPVPEQIYFSSDGSASLSYRECERITKSDRLFELMRGW